MSGAGLNVRVNGAYARARRIELGISPRQGARALGVGVVAYTGIEAGLHMAPRCGVEAWARLLGCTPARLLEDEPEPHQGALDLRRPMRSGGGR